MWPRHDRIPPSPVYPLRPDIEDYFAPANSNKLREPNRLGGGGGRSGGLTKLYYQLVSWKFRDSSHGEAYRRGSTMVTMGPARDYAY
jgi:hypothetical protein